MVHINEATDPLLLVNQLRQENRDLRAQLALLRAGVVHPAPETKGTRDPDSRVVAQAVEVFLEDSSPTAAADLGSALQALQGGLAYGIALVYDMCMTRVYCCSIWNKCVCSESLKCGCIDVCML